MPNYLSQGYGSMSAPTKEFEKLVLSGKIEHFGNPVLRWMLASTIVKTDPNSVTSIGQSAFMACIALTNTTIPSSVDAMGIMHLAWQQI